MNYFTRLELGATSLRPTLLPEENVIIIQDKVGLYDGNVKSTLHNEGTVYLTSLRILYVDSTDPQSNSVAVLLQTIGAIESYSGLLRSSPKITLRFFKHPTRNSTSNIEFIANSGLPSLPWECHICHCENSATASKCQLCGVAKSNSLPTSSGRSTDVNGPLGNIPDGELLLACPACTFLNHPELFSCEICETEIKPEKKQVDDDYEMISRSSPPTDVSLDSKYVKLAFRGGGFGAFLGGLKSALVSKAWNRPREKDAQKSSQEFAPALGGISGILQSVKQTHQERDESLTQAFQDLDALMRKAADMVKLAESITSKLNKEPFDTLEVEASSFRTYLLELGVSNPITKDSAGAAYHRELSKELAEFLSVVLEREGGMKSLTDIYCIFNRARGVALISPDDLYKACQLFEILRLPMRLPIRFAEIDNLPLAIATEQLLMAEQSGIICRDATVAGLTFYKNIINECKLELNHF
ncbi:uncharacterized protein VTP21DRAFT_10428 [Calcarisporiella thermophila]|uniref:uncharacterized protein n=1 Tax=Calcarisporiella thermophila TaxID=911321 RepID=UPI003744B150